MIEHIIYVPAIYGLGYITPWLLSKFGKAVVSKPIVSVTPIETLAGTFTYYLVKDATVVSTMRLTGIRPETINKGHGKGKVDTFKFDSPHPNGGWIYKLES